MKKFIYILAFAGFGIITTEFSVIGILPVIAREFNISIDTAGWLLSGFALTIAVTGPFTVMLTSKINRKWLMISAMSVFVLSNIVSVIAPNFTVLMIARVVPALLHPVYWSVAFATASRQVAPKNVPKAVAVVMSAISIGTVLGVPLTTYVADIINWQAAFIVAGIINVAGLCALMVKIPSMPAEKGAHRMQLIALRNPQLWISLLVTIIMISGMFSSYGYMAEFLTKVSHMNGKEISLMLLLFGATSIAGNWLAGYFLSRNVMLTTRLFLLALIGVHLLVYSFGGLFVPVTIIVALWGLIHTHGFMVSQTLISREAPEAPELATSLMVSFGNAGFALGSFLGGIIISRFGTHNIVWMSILLLAVTLALSFVNIKKQASVTSKKVKTSSVDNNAAVAA